MELINQILAWGIWANPAAYAGLVVIGIVMALVGVLMNRLLRVVPIFLGAVLTFYAVYEFVVMTM